MVSAFLSGIRNAGAARIRRALRVLLAGLVVVISITKVYRAETLDRCPLDGAVPSSSAAAQRLLCANGSGTLLIVGELHGTVETPALVAELARQAVGTQAVRLGLEASTYLAPLLAAYVRSSGSPADRAALLRSGYWKGQDGRASTGWLDLVDTVRKLRGNGADIDVFVTEPDYVAQAKAHPGAAIFSQAVKENGMVDAIEQAHRAAPRALVIALMGNFHAGLFRNSQEPADGSQRSVAERLKAASPLVVYPMAGRGEAWSCTGDGCGVHAVSGAFAPKIATPSFAPDPEDSRVVRTVLLWLPRFSASRPAVTEKK